jgi:hypothetical protein
MYCLGVVPQRRLREPLRVATFQRPLRPRIPIAVQRHPGNPQPVTPLLELRRPIPGAHGAKIGNSGPAAGRRFKSASISALNRNSVGLRFVPRDFNFARE